MMALHIEIPAVPERDLDRDQDATRPPHTVPPRLDCSREDLRQANDYVRTPCHLTPFDPTHHRTTVKDASKSCVHYSAQSTTTDDLVFTEVLTPDLKEPEPRLPSKQNGSDSVASTSAWSSCGGPYFICPRCHRCRCEKCREQPQFSCNTYEYSGDRLIECFTCMCCIRGTFYHCCEGAEEDNDYYENPCGCCSPPRCFVRWLVIIVISLFLPCLLFYWPVRGALALSAQCYNMCVFKGCRCDRQRPASRPLVEAENSSV